MKRDILGAIVVLSVFCAVLKAWLPLTVAGLATYFLVRDYR